MVQRVMNGGRSIGATLDGAGLGSRSCIAIIGAGGKTTTMASLAAHAASRGCRVLVTTTTKIWPPDLPLLLMERITNLTEELRGAFCAAGIVALGERVGPEGKVRGISQELICRLHQQGAADLILCEADGAAGRSLKGYREGEPVVPSCSTAVLIVAGIDSIGKPVDEDAVCRLREFCATTGAVPGTKIQAQDIASALVSTAHFAPSGASIVYVLNKVDNSIGQQAARDVRREIQRSIPGSRVVLATYGSEIVDDRVEDRADTECRG